MRPCEHKYRELETISYTCESAEIIGVTSKDLPPPSSPSSLVGIINVDCPTEMLCTCVDTYTLSYDVVLRERVEGTSRFVPLNILEGYLFYRVRPIELQKFVVDVTGILVTIKIRAEHNARNKRYDVLRADSIKLASFKRE